MNAKTIFRTMLFSSIGFVVYNALFSSFGDIVLKNSSSALASRNERQLTIDLGNGQCEWTEPQYNIPEDIDFFKTLITGFPSGDKRLAFVQMEALTGWAAKDEWDFQYLGITNEPFVKANYPHHEGIHGWGDVADQVVMVVRNMRRSLVEYHDILWDIGYAKTWEVASQHLDNLYAERPPLEDFLEWRDLRVMDEIHWYGWFIDYYMENGLKRDIFTHKITTEEHWDMLMMPTVYSKDQVQYDLIVGDQEVTPIYDPVCTQYITRGCHPVQIISAERLVETQSGRGPAENRKIAESLQGEGKEGISQYLIDESVWECVWTELIINKKGLKTFIDRGGVREHDYSFSEEMLNEMLNELDRLITKYSGPDWNSKKSSQDLVELLVEHRGYIKDEHLEVTKGLRQLNKNDFLGPEERKLRKQKNLEEANLNKKFRENFGDIFGGTSKESRKLESKDYTEYFKELQKAALKHRRVQVKDQVMKKKESKESKKHQLFPW